MDNTLAQRARGVVAQISSFALSHNAATAVGRVLS